MAERNSDEPLGQYAVLIQWLPAQQIVFYRAGDVDEARELAERDHPPAEVGDRLISKVGLVVPVPKP